MAVELFLKPEQLKLIPVTAHDQEIISGLLNQDYRATLKTADPRSVKQNRFYWKILGLVVENQSHYQRPEALHVALKERLGYFKVLTLHDKTKYHVYDSTSFDKMDSVTFKKFMDAALDVIIIEVIPGMNRKDLVNEVESMLGYSYNDLWIPKETEHDHGRRDRLPATG